MNIEDRVPQRMVGAPGDGLDHARALLSVIESWSASQSEAVTELDCGFGLYLLASLAGDLIEHEQSKYRLVPKEADA